MYYTWAGKSRTGRRWAVALIQKLWDIAWDLWEHRNGHVHRTTPNNLALINAAARIRHEYAAGSALLTAEDQHLFCQPIDTMLASPLVVQQAWLDLVQVARTQAQRRDRAAYRQERNFLRSWLQGTRENTTNAAH